MKAFILLRTFVNALAVFGPSHRVIQLLHQITLPSKLLRPLLKVTFKHFSLTAVHLLNQIHLSRPSGIEERVKVVIVVSVLDIDFWAYNRSRHVSLREIRKAFNFQCLDRDGIGINCSVIDAASSIVRRI